MLFESHRTIAHLDMDSFYVSVECLKNDRLKGKPLLIGGLGDRGVVAACSYEARRFGVHSAMPMKVARRLCPQAIIMRGDMDSYSKYSRTITDIVREQAPAFEKSSIDEFYIDLTGMDKFFGCSKYAGELRQTITRETGLPVSYGLSVNKLVSKVATDEAKPNGQLEIAFGQEKSFLAPLPVTKLPMVGEKTGSLLQQMGVATIKTLSEIPLELMENLLGKNGIELWRRAQGIDDTPVVPYQEQKSISTETTFDNDTIDINFLKAQLMSMTEKIAFELRQQNKLAGCVAVKIRYADYNTLTRQCTISYTSLDHELIAAVKALFDKLYERRQLVRLIGVKFMHLVPGNYQISLFDDSDHLIRLYQALDGLNFRFGRYLVMRAGGLAERS